MDMWQNNVQETRAAKIRFLSGLFCLCVPSWILILIQFVLLRENVSWTNTQTFFVWSFFVLVSALSFTLYRQRLRLFLPMLLVYALLYFLFSFHPFNGRGEFDWFYQQGNWFLYLTVFYVALVFGAALQRSRLIVYGFVVAFLYGFIESMLGYAILTFNHVVLNFILQFGSIVFFIWTYEHWRAFDFNVPNAFNRFILREGIGLMGILIALIVFIFLGKETIQESLNSRQQYKHAIPAQLEEDKDGHLKLKETMGLMEINARSKQDSIPLFCAHIQFSLFNDRTSQPLYLTTYHFTHFDTVTETFERDLNSPFNDEFKPEFDSLPLYHVWTDSSIYKRYDTLKHSVKVETDIYLKRLSKTSVIAPSSAYWVQPLPVSEAYKNEYYYSYKTYSTVSALNSAYFIYNAKDPFLQMMQTARFEALREAPPMNQLPTDFLRYYTFFPTEGQYQPIKRLADSLQEGKLKAIDKIIAVRDYFLQTDEQGVPMYSYTDNPGIPGIPGASNILRFLFETHQGYCAYYAAATVAILRSMGLPARVVSGFMTVDRSDQNDGWYWYYADQSHAWVQVYFPEFGWIDFDTTVGNEDAHEAPRPDATPPQSPPTASVIWSGQIQKLDTSNQTILLHVNQLLWGDVRIESMDTAIKFDVSKAVIKKDTQALTFNALQLNQKVTLISFNPSLANSTGSTLWQEVISSSPKPMPMDAVYVIDTSSTNPSIEEIFRHKHWGEKFVQWVVLFLVSCLLFVLLAPWLVFRYWLWRAQLSKNSLHPWYRYFLYELHMSGLVQGNRTLREFVQHDFDSAFGEPFILFLSLYWEEKYAGGRMSSDQLHRGFELARKSVQQLKLIQQRSPWFNYHLFFQFWQNYLTYKTNANGISRGTTGR